MSIYIYGKKRLGTILVAGLLCCLSFCSCGMSQDESADAQVKTVTINPLSREQTSVVEYGDVIRRELYDGIVSPYVEELTFPEDGVFENYKVSLGEQVVKGQILATTNVEEAEKQVESYQEKIETLTSNYEYNMQTKKNSQEIAEINLQMVYDELEAEDYGTKHYTELCIRAGQYDAQIRRLDLEMKHLTEDYEIELPYMQEKLLFYQKKLDGNRIVAPFDGVVTAMKPLTCGDKVTGEVSYVAISDTSRYLVMGQYIGPKNIEKAVSVTAFINGKEYPLEYIPMDQDEYFAILKKGEVPYSSYELEPSEEISHGMFALIVYTDAKKEDVLLLPGIAVWSEGRLKYCYRKNGDEREKVYVEVGLYDSINYEVVSGLKEGDEVYLD